MCYVYLDEAYESETFWNTKGLHGMIQRNIQTLVNHIQIQTWVRQQKEQKTTERYLHNNMLGNSHAGQY